MPERSVSAKGRIVNEILREPTVTALSIYLPNLPPPSGTNNGVTDYVRQEIRAIVGARQQGPRTPQQITVGPGQSVSAADCEALGLYLEMPAGEI